MIYQNIQLSQSIINKKTARDWLSTMQNNRPISHKHVDNLKKMMDKGEWVINGDTIRFSPDGNLIDGQHRLEAFVSSKMEDLFVITVGNLPDKAFETMDTGKVRGGKDTLAIAGYQNSIRLASAARYLVAYERSESLSYLSHSVTNIEIHSCVQRHPMLSEFATIMSSRQTKQRFYKSYCIALHYLFACVDYEKSCIFFDRLSDGAGLDSNSPILMLRERIIDEKTLGPRRAKYQMKDLDMIALIIKSWNFYHEGRTTHFLKWASGQGEKFPKIKALNRDNFLLGKIRPNRGSSSIAA